MRRVCLRWTRGGWFHCRFLCISEEFEKKIVCVCKIFEVEYRDTNYGFNLEAEASCNEYSIWIQILNIISLNQTNKKYFRHSELMLRFQYVTLARNWNENTICNFLYKLYRLTTMCFLEICFWNGKYANVQICSLLHFKFFPTLITSFLYDTSFVFQWF